MTIIEVIVVIVILSLAAGLAIPRLFGGPGRAVEASADEAAAVLSALARRDATQSEPLALEYDEESSVLRLLVLRTRDGERAWRSDRLLPSAQLSGVVVVEMRHDQQRFSEEGFRIELDQFTPRGEMVLVLADESQRAFATVRLMATALQAQVESGDGRNRASEGGAMPASIDLDALGQEGQAW